MLAADRQIKRRKTEKERERTGGARERTLASHSRLFRILFPHLTILVHEPPAHLYASVVVLATRRGEKLYNETRTRVPDTHRPCPIKGPGVRTIDVANRREDAAPVYRALQDDNEAARGVLRQIAGYAASLSRPPLKNCLNARSHSAGALIGTRNQRDLQQVGSTARVIRANLEIAWERSAPLGLSSSIATTRPATRFKNRNKDGRKCTRLISRNNYLHVIA